MKRFNLKNALRSLSAAGLVIAAVCTQTSCSDLWSEQHPGTYYINSGETIASFLEEGEYKDDFTSFVYVLKKAGIWGELRTYGEHTCFAPTNEAFDAYMKKRYDEAPDNRKSHYTSLDSLTVSECDTIAKTHLCGTTFFCSDMSGDGAFPYPNLMDRYLTYYSFPDTVPAKTKDGRDTIKVKLGFKINQVSKIIEADDTVQNGVVHIVENVVQPSNKWLPGLMEENPEISIFFEAVKATGLRSELEKYVDPEYPWAPTKGRDPKSYYDSTISHFKATTKTDKTLIYDTGAEKDQMGTIPDLRYFKYTMFVVKDSVLKSRYGVTDVDGLRNLAKTIYPDGAGYEDISDSSSLKKFLMYHILPMQLEYNKLNLTGTKNCAIVEKNRSYLDELDVEDFYEPMLPHSIMRVSTPYTDNTHAVGIFINRKGTEKTGLDAAGIRIANPSEYNGVDASAMNGCYHYIDDILKYDTDVRENVLNTRMRVMANTMSPDFINSGAAGRTNEGAAGDKYTVGFLKGFCTNFEALNDNTQFWVRYADQSFGTWMGYEMTIRGIYDLAIKLPNVPFDGTWEVRLWVNSMSTFQGQANPRGIVQFYFSDGQIDKYGSKVWKACGIPVDLRIPGDDARIGNVPDDDIKKLDEDNYENNLELYDKAMRNRGYMKGMDSYNPSGSEDQNLRKSTDCNRKIVCNEFMRADGTYWLRMRQVMDTESADFPFCFVEMVPKSIYASETVKEDRH